MKKLTLITGASRGLGKAAAIELATHNHDIIFTYLHNQQAADDVVTTIEKLGARAVAIQADIRDVNSLGTFTSKLKDLLLHTFERNSFDHLINNAGTGIHSPLEQTQPDELDDMLNVHVKGPFFLTQALLPLIEEGGHIVNISSGLTRFSFPGSGPYAIAKGAVEVMTRYMAKEFADKKIRVNTLAPGAIATDFRNGAIRDNEQAQSMVSSLTALGRVGEADDIGKAVAAILSGGFDWVTGQRIEASGGMML